MQIYLKLHLFDRSLRPFGSSVGALLLTTGLVCYSDCFFKNKFFFFLFMIIASKYIYCTRRGVIFNTKKILCKKNENNFWKRIWNFI